MTRQLNCATWTIANLHYSYHDEAAAGSGEKATNWNVGVSTLLWVANILALLFVYVFLSYQYKNSLLLNQGT